MPAPPAARPDVARGRLRRPRLAEGLFLEVEVHAAGERIGDGERRGGEVVRLHLRMDPGLEVPVPRRALHMRRGPLRRRRARRGGGAGRSCRCTWCSRSRPCGSRAPPGGGSGPAASRYLVTTFEPGARLDFTHGRRGHPRSTAFFASSPAATITCGLEVFVHLVIAAITTAPWSSRTVSPSISHQITALPDSSADVWNRPDGGS